MIPEADAELSAPTSSSPCVAAELAAFKAPKMVLFTTADELPTTPTGKVQKFRLVERAVAVLITSEAGS